MKTIMLAVSCLLLSSCKVRENSSLKASENSVIIKYDHYNFYHTIGANSLSFAYLDSLREKHNAKNLTEFLTVINKDPLASGLFKNFVLIHSSESEKNDLINFQLPRVIVHKDNVFMAFVPGYEMVEFFEYNLDQENFIPHMIDFSKESAQVDQKLDDCKTCHGSSPQPIWEPYAFWPSSYGSNDDRTDNKRERDELSKFIADQSKHSLYSFLKFPKTSFLSLSPNFHLTFHLFHLNFRRVWKLLERSEPYKKNPALLKGALLSCANIEDFFPKDKKPQVGFDDHKKELAQMYLTYQLFQLKRHQDHEYKELKRVSYDYTLEERLKNLDGDRNFPFASAAIAYVLKQSNIDFNSLFISRSPNVAGVNLISNAGAANGDDDNSYILHDYLRAKLADTKYQPDIKVDVSGLCDDLKKASLDSFSATNF